MTKIDIISGFLGAGKTTFIKKLLEEAIAGEQVVLIENEFGEIGIDGGFLKNSGIEIREMNSGCICCSLVGDFGASLAEVLKTYKPDRVIIEPSGVGKLSDVMKAVRDVSADMDVILNSAVTIVDAAKCKMYMKNFGEFFNNQIENAGTIVLSRTDVADEKKVEAAAAMIREHNAKASIVTTPCAQLTGPQLLEIIEKPDTMMEDLLKEVEASHHDHEHHHHEHEHECGCGHDHEHHHEHMSAAVATTMNIITSMTMSAVAVTTMSIITSMSMTMSAVAATSMSIITSITTTTAKDAPAAAMITTTIITQMKYSPAGGWKRLLQLPEKNWKQFWRIYLRPPFTATF